MSYHTSTPTHKRGMSPKQLKVIQNDPVYVGALKKQMQQQDFMKNQKAQEEANVKLHTDASPMLDIQSTNTIVDPCLPSPLIFSRQNWKKYLKVKLKKIWGLFMTHAVDPIRVYNFLKKKKLPNTGFSTEAEIRRTVVELFKKFHQDFLNGNTKNISQYASEVLLKEVTAEIQKRPKINVDIQWDGEISNIKKMSYRMIIVPPPINRNYVQIVYAITSHQTHKLIDKKTKEVVGGNTIPETLTVYWGFEKRLEKPNSKWILVERLSIEQ